MKTIIEPFKIKSVEPIRFSTPEEREVSLRKGFYNLVLIPAQDVLIDLLTDSGTAADKITNNAALTLSTAASDVTRTYTLDGGTAAASYTAPTTDGSHTVVVTDTDTAGNTASSTTLTFTRDT